MYLEIHIPHTECRLSPKAKVAPGDGGTLASEGETRHRAQAVSEGETPKA